MRGFTLIELILVIAIISALAVLSVPVLGNFSGRTQIDSTTNEIVSALRFAEQKAMAVENDSQFGVYFDDANNKFYLFRGTSYTDFPSERIEYVYSDSITVTQSFVDNDVDFNKLYGTTSDTGNITVTNNIGGSRTVNVSALGKIERN